MASADRRRQQQQQRWAQSGKTLIILFLTVVLVLLHLWHGIKSIDAACMPPVLAWGMDSVRAADNSTHVAAAPRLAADPCLMPIARGVPPFKKRVDLGAIVEEERMSRGAELGVKRGELSSKILTRWGSCEEYLLVDLWSQQQNYKDSSNVDNKEQETNYQTTLKNTEKWADKRKICRNYTSECVKNVSDSYFDFIYVDARHDFKGVYEDLVSWWPKLRIGGIFAGHDYVTQDDGPKQTNQDWTTNYDGSVDETGTVVKGAVDKFASEVCRQVTVSYRERGWNTWAMRK